MINPKILKKAQKKLKKEKEYRQYITTCIAARICPKDGDVLKIKEKRGVTIYSCNSCHFSHKEYYYSGD